MRESGPIQWDGVGWCSPMSKSNAMNTKWQVIDISFWRAICCKLDHTTSIYQRQQSTSASCVGSCQKQLQNGCHSLFVFASFVAQMSDQRAKNDHSPHVNYQFSVKVKLAEIVFVSSANSTQSYMYSIANANSKFGMESDSRRTQQRRNNLPNRAENVSCTSSFFRSFVRSFVRSLCSTVKSCLSHAVSNDNNDNNNNDNNNNDHSDISIQWTPLLTISQWLRSML